MRFLALNNSAQYGLPGAASGFAGSPLVQAWSRKVQAGQPVTIEEHNAVVLALAWCSDVLAAKPGTAFPHYGAREGSQDVLVLGARAFEVGDIIQPAGTAVAPPVPRWNLPDVRQTEGRRIVWQASQDALRNMEISSGMVVLGPPVTRPSGLAGLAYIAIGGVVLAAAGVGIYGLWKWQTEETEQVRIRENSHTVRNTEVTRAAVQIESLRLNTIVRTGRDIPPNPAFALPLTQPGSQITTPGGNASTIDLATVGKYLGGGAALLAALAAAAWMGDRAWARNQAQRHREKNLPSGMEESEAS